MKQDEKTTKRSFVHLHTHSDASSLDGVAKIPDLVRIAKLNENSAIAITDHGVMSNTFHLFNECKKNGIKPIIGCEFYMTNVMGQTDEDGKRIDRKANHQILLAKNNLGYRNLCYLNYKSFIDGFYYRPKITRNWLFDNKDGIICTTSCMSHEINGLLLQDNLGEAERIFDEYHHHFKDDFYVELQFNELEEQRRLNNYLIDLAKSKNVKIILTGDVHYAEKGDDEVQDLLIHINRKTTIETPDEDKFALHARNLFLMSDDDFFEHNKKFGYHYDEKNVQEYLENTLEIADKINFEFKTGKLNFPVFKCEKSSDKKLKEICYQNFIKLHEEKVIPADGHKIEEYKTRLDYEMDAIVNNGFADYFLILWDLCEYAKQKEIRRGASRGSASCSLVSFMLGITSIDSIKFDLMFERFMGGSKKEDVRTPDIDMDWDSDRKDELEQYLVDKYGEDKVIHVVTNSTFNIKGVLRDLTRVLCRDKEDIELICKYIGDDKYEGVKEYFEELYNTITNKRPIDITKKEQKVIAWINGNQDLIGYAEKLAGSIRHYGKHACALVITPEPIYEFIPVNRVQGKIVTGFQESGSQKELQALGLLKIDLLGLNTVSIIGDCIKLIKKNKNIDITKEIDNVSLYDTKIYEEFAKGNNDFIFQFSGDGIGKLIKEVNPDCFDDICAINSLYRPANLSAGTAWDYARNKNDKKCIEYVHDSLIPILEKTYGILCYQEQSMQICHDVAGFTWSESDKARKILEKIGTDKDFPIEERIKFREKFINGCEKNGVPKLNAGEIFDWLSHHSGYTFNKSHSVAYSYLAIQTLFLKVYYPLEFYTVVLSRAKYSKTNIEDFAAAVDAAFSHNIEFKNFDINTSNEEFTIFEDKIELGLRIISGLGQKAIKQICDNRPYIDLYDFCYKNVRKNSQLSKPNLKVIAQLGLFDSFNTNRFQVEHILQKYAEKREKYAENRQMFEDDIKSILENEVVFYEMEEKSKFEIEHIGVNIVEGANDFSMRNEKIRAIVNSNIVKKISDVKNENSFYSILCQIKKIKIHTDKNGNEMAFVKIQDIDGNTESVTIFAKQYKIIKDSIYEGVIAVLSAHTKDDTKLIFGPKNAWNLEDDAFRGCFIVI